MHMRFEGKTAIVTGAAQGIGRATAIRLAAGGAKVVVADVQFDQASAVAAEIENAGGQAFAIGHNVTSREETEALVLATVDRFGSIDILVNNAGVYRFIPVLAIEEAEWDLVFNVNCKGLLLVTQAVARQMIDQGRGGKIVNLASQAGRAGNPLVLTYCASKAAVISMTQSMALAFAPHGITVNAVAPGIIDTPLWAEIDKGLSAFLEVPSGEPMRRFLEGVPLGRPGTAEDVASVIAFLASADADYVTQQTYNVDGGIWPG